MQLDLARGIYRKLSDDLARHHRNRIELSFSGAVSAHPAVYFLAPDYDVPAGGTRVIYRHVDILNSNGFRARALHERPGFRYSWFDNETAVASLRTTRLDANDLLVVSELDIDLLWRKSMNIRHVIFNQSGHLTWERSRDQVNRHYRSNPHLAAVVAVSSHSQALLQYAFPATDVRRVHLGLDPRLFHPSEGERRRRIAYMPRRGKGDAELVLTLLANRGLLDGWEVVKLHGLTHAEVARQLRSTMIFLAFPHQEGFGLPAVEAMACGNYVIGYHGYGGREFYDPAFSTAIEPGDVLKFARAVEQVFAREREQAGWCADRGRRAAAFVLSEYSTEREQQEVTSLYGEFLQAAQREPNAPLALGVE